MPNDNLPSPRDAAEADAMRAAYVAGANDVIAAVAAVAPLDDRAVSRMRVRVERAAAQFWPSFPPETPAHA